MVSRTRFPRRDEMNAVRIQNRQDVRRAAEALRDIAFDLAGLRVAASHDISNRRSLVDLDGNILAKDIFGWGDAPDVWWKNPRLALNSPITLACRFEGGPFWVNAEGFRTRWPNPRLDTIDLSHFETLAMAHAALVAPVHLPFGQIGAVSFHPIDSKSSNMADLFDSHSDALGLLAAIFIVSYTQVMSVLERTPLHSPLSKREVECLRWVALGKTDDQIAILMGLTRATIRFHMRNATQKLTSANRSQALFKATQLGYVSAVI